MINGLIFLVVWLATVRWAWIERERAMKAETYIHAVATATAAYASEMAAQSARMTAHVAVKEKMAPFVESQESMEGTEDQKHYRTLLDFLKVHPGISIESAEAALASLKAK